MRHQRYGRLQTWIAIALLGGLPIVAVVLLVARNESPDAVASSTSPRQRPPASIAGPRTEPSPLDPAATEFQPRFDFDASGFTFIVAAVEPWQPDASLDEIAKAWRGVGFRHIDLIDRQIAESPESDEQLTGNLYGKALMYNFEGQADKAYDTISQLRSVLERRADLASERLYTTIYYQGVTALRIGENENCIMCRGESSCILPIAPAAIHVNPKGSRLAIEHFTEYLDRFPDDLEVKWLLNLAHMTLGEHPQGVEPRYLISLDEFLSSEFDLGRFRDIGEQVGLNRLNQAGGAILEDFDNDGLLDLVTTTMEPTTPMACFGNRGDGTFDDRSLAAGVTSQLGGLNCVQTDFDNDGLADVLVVRGAWLKTPIRPSLLRNEGGWSFRDVTDEAGVADPVNSISGTWADYDNDGWLDLFVCCERQPNKLYHNRRDGTFVDVAAEAGVAGSRDTCKGAAWLDYDNDDDPDLFLNNLNGLGRLFQNDGAGKFTDVSVAVGFSGPQRGFSCWAWDYDNDGLLDIFATSYDRTLGDVVRGLLDQPHDRLPNKLYRNVDGRRFEDATVAAGLDGVYSTMGSNFADLDNDGFLDFYLGTGDPSLSTLVPNRMFKNVGGQRFSEITASSGTGNLQKGHGVACGDWDRDGDNDLFIQMGGAAVGDKYHNILFQNPGQGNNWLTVKLKGVKTNRPAIGARIKLVADGETPMTIHRHISSGSSFGANPFEQTIGLGKSNVVEQLEIHWPTSGTTQVFRDVAVNQAIEITELEEAYRPLDQKPLPAPQSPP